ncbi:hypothetical protein B0A52_01576 [Exophiala mesophila]|uniref:DOMON domain-containing protein n=1 Tax=Exophiala mesophila TaxID=212818 RepID=A0A438NFG2_EXOME|nr:hypothetical protein B0A52_01576 [Exophiala mesophila]
MAPSALKSILATTALVVGSAAQFATYVSNGITLAVNVPSDTASSGSGPIYLQISAPSGTQWVGFGQGTRMSGANMLIVYTADSNNVTVSPRLGGGYVEPEERSDASVFVLEGSGITSDGAMVANIRCDSCLSWSGGLSGSMDPTSTSSNWIYAWRDGDAIDSTSTDATISRHDGYSRFTLDLTEGTGGNSVNPFIAATGSDDVSDDDESTTTAATNSASTGSATATATATGSSSTLTTTAVGTPTNGVSGPVVSSDSDSSNSSPNRSQSGPDDGIRIGHGVVMGLVFLILMPLSALTVYMPHHQKVRYIHAPLQVVSIVLMIVGLGLGIRLAQNIDDIDGYHQIIGFVVVGWMIAVQPALGIAQHMHFRRNGTRSPMGRGHKWMGRAVILLGVVNGGLGFMITGPVGSLYVPTYGVIIYSVVAAVIFLLYLGVVVYTSISSKRNNSLPGEKPRPGTEGYEMHGGSFEARRNLRT